MKKMLLLAATAALSLNMQAQPPADTTPTYPQGATYTHSSGTVWNLTADTSIGTLVNNGTINRNGYTLTYTSKSGSGTINETTGIEEVRSQTSDGRGETYTLDGRKAGASAKCIVIMDGKKVVKR